MQLRIRLAFAYPMEAMNIGKTSQLNLARLLRPKTSTCGNNFTLEVNSLSFISHPIDTSSIVLTKDAKV